jgi:hypothetical protein
MIHGKKPWGADESKKKESEEGNSSDKTCHIIFLFQVKTMNKTLFDKERDDQINF